MKSKGTWQIAVGSAALAATLFVLPTPLFQVASGSADAGATGLFILGLALLAGGLGFLGYGLCPAFPRAEQGAELRHQGAVLPGRGPARQPVCNVRSLHCS